MTIRRKTYTQAYFLIKTNHAYEGSFATRLKYVGLSCTIAAFALFPFLSSTSRLKSVEGEKFQ
jgi:hypothetical protein